MSEISQTDAREMLRLLHAARGMLPVELCGDIARLLDKYPVLKPCPFCGSPAIMMSERKLAGSDVRRQEVWCMDCAGGVTRETQHGAADAWNRRP